MYPTLSDIFWLYLDIVLQSNYLRNRYHTVPYMQVKNTILMSFSKFLVWHVSKTLYLPAMFGIMMYTDAQQLTGYAT